MIHIEKDIELNAEELAREFSEQDCEQQAEFFNKNSFKDNNWNHGMAIMQIDYFTKLLDENGREFIKRIYDSMQGWSIDMPPNSFIEEFNKNKVSDEFLDSCKKAGNLFNKKQSDAPNYKQYINDLIELLMRFENDVVCMELNHWKPDETNETWCSRNCGKNGTCPSKECYMEYLKMKEYLRGENNGNE